jgi:hypothetical protein
LGWGVVFKLTPDGTETVVHNFTPASDGGNPEAGVFIDKRGGIYGTLANNGQLCKFAIGTVFRLAADGSEKVWCVPATTGGGVIEKNGYIYGTGTEGPHFGDGLVFQIKR